MQLPIKEIKKMTDKVFLYEDRVPKRRLKEQYRNQEANSDQQAQRGGANDGFANNDNYLNLGRDDHKYEE